MRKVEPQAVSEHLIRVFSCLKEATTWLTSREIATLSDVSERTARSHALRLVRAGLANQVQAFPGHRYKLAANASDRNSGFLRRLEQMSAVVGRAPYIRK